MASLTDWLFMGDWLYKRYNENPEIWRHPRGQGEMRAIAWAAPLPFVTCAVLTLLCVTFQGRIASYEMTCDLADHQAGSVSFELFSDLVASS